MRQHRVYGREADNRAASLPNFETFRYRALELKHGLRLCEFCLQGWRRCYEAKRAKRAQRSWKRHRSRQSR